MSLPLPPSPMVSPSDGTGRLPTPLDIAATGVHVDASGSFERFEQMARQARADGARALLLLAAEGNHWPPAAVDGLLRSLGMPVCGGVFPRVMVGATTHPRGSIVWPLQRTVVVTAVPDAWMEPQPAGDITSMLRRQHGADRSLLVLVGAAAGAPRFLQSLGRMLGDEVDLFGARAGRSDASPGGCLFSSDGLTAGGAQVVGLGRAPWVHAAGHGWQTAAGPFCVTRARGCVVEELDFAPAAEVYRAAVERIRRRRLEGGSFLDVARVHPLGLRAMGGALEIRQPVEQRRGALVCASEVPAFSRVSVMHADADALVSAAGTCARELRARSTLTASTRRGARPALVFASWARSRRLGLEHHRELDAITAGLGADVTAFGALTLGEIASGCDGAPLSHDQAVVIARPAVVS